MPALDLVPIWTAILAVGVFFYVALDGFDLGVGMLYNFAPDRDARNLVMNSIAPIWDGNETWLILGSVGLLAAFPVAFAIIIPAVYFPILLMLFALIFRGLAFEFRYRDAEHRTFWDHGFAVGSALAAFAQGIILGAFIQGFNVEGRQFVGGSFDCFTPFSVFAGIALMFGYALLGAGWLIIKTEGALQDWARALGRRCLIGTVLGIGIVSLWTPYVDAQYRHALVHLAQYRLSRAGAADHRGPDLVRVAVAQRQIGICAVLRLSRPVRHVLYRHRDQPVADDRARAFHVAGGGGFAEHAGLPPHRHAGPVADRSCSIPAGHIGYSAARFAPTSDITKHLPRGNWSKRISHLEFRQRQYGAHGAGHFGCAQPQRMPVTR